MLYDRIDYSPSLNYTYFKFDDASFIIRQCVLPFQSVNPIIKFGPLTENLKDLMGIMKFNLEISGFTYQRKVHLKLIRGDLSYRIKTAPLNEFLAHDNLAYFVNEKVDYLERKLDLAKSNPFNDLMIKYPRSKKKISMIGNQTIKEYVLNQLNVGVI